MPVSSASTPWEVVRRPRYIGMKPHAPDVFRQTGSTCRAHCTSRFKFTAY
jgi:hypothetical protein